jgi:hypothetical protein
MSGFPPSSRSLVFRCYWDAASRMALRRARSLLLALRIAMVIKGGTSLEKPEGSPRFRSSIRVLPPPASPRVRRFHGERPFVRAHDEALACHELAFLIAVGQTSSQEPRPEFDLRTDFEGLGGLPLDRGDVRVPLRGVVRITHVRGDFGARTVNLDRGLHVHSHTGIVESRSLDRQVDRMIRAFHWQVGVNAEDHQIHGAPLGRPR